MRLAVLIGVFSLLYGQDVTTVIVLINGQEIKGKIIDQGQYLIIETDKGRMKTIYYNKIDYILTDSSLEPVEKVLERRSSRPQKNPKTAPGRIPPTYATFTEILATLSCLYGCMTFIFPALMI